MFVLFQKLTSPLVPLSIYGEGKSENSILPYDSPSLKPAKG
jgi:hypothetical protein